MLQCQSDKLSEFLPETSRYNVGQSVKQHVRIDVRSKARWFATIWVCLKIGYIPNEIAIKNRDNDQQNHWVKRATRHFQTKPYIKIPVNPIKSHWPIAGGSDLGGLLLGQPAEGKFQGFRAWAKGLWTERWSHGLTESPRLIDFMVYNTCKYNT